MIIKSSIRSFTRGRATAKSAASHLPLPYTVRALRPFANTTPPPSFPRPPRKAFALCILALACGSAFTAHSLEEDDDAEDQTLDLHRSPSSSDPLARLTHAYLASTTAHLSSKPLKELMRSYFVYLFSESSLLVDLAPKLESSLGGMRDHVPLFGPAAYSVFRFLMRHTFFPIFVGGETVEDTQDLMRALMNTGCGTVLNYSVEAEEPSRSTDGMHVHELIVQRTSEAIRLAGNFPSSSEGQDLKTTWVAIKLSGIIKDPTVLERATNALLSSSSYQRGIPLPSGQTFPLSPELSAQDEAALQELLANLQRIGRQAKEAGVRIDIDAEQTWFQPAIDRFYTLLASELNTSLPIIYNTYQTYLTDTSSRLAQAYQEAQSADRSFGAKLVRGAYMDSERLRATKLNRPSPVCKDKEETDKSYDSCSNFMVDAIGQDKGGVKIGCMFASHNVESVRKSLEDLKEKGLIIVVKGKLVFGEEISKKVVFGQLLGMADSLTGTLLSMIQQDSTNLPVVIKYVPWGEIDNTIPYLIRRAQENKSVLQSKGEKPTGAKAQRILVGKEIRKRLLFSGVMHLL